MLRRLFLNSSSYALGSFLVTLAGLISFPLFTRTFSVAEYGTLNLISSVLLLWTGVGKLGLQQSIVRFHAEVTASNCSIAESAFISTVLIGMACTGLAATVAAVLVNCVIPGSWWHNDVAASLMVPLSLLILLRVMDSGCVNILRAQERSFFLSAYNVVKKYATLATILLLMFFYIPGIRGFYTGTIVAEFIAVTAMLLYFVRACKVSLSKFSPEIFRRMVLFGVPMIALEISGIVLNLGDRYVVQAILGGDALGQYSAAYNFCEYFKTVLIASFAQAVLPMYLKIWESKGTEATNAFIERVLRIYILLAMPVLAGMLAIGTEVLTLLASEKYLAGAVVIPYVIGGFFLEGLVPILGAGVFIQKQNRLLIPGVMFTAVINIFLNIVLLPIFGIVAAGVATMICYAMLCGIAWNIGAKRLRVKVPIGDVCKFAALACAMYFVVVSVRIPHPEVELLARILVGCIVYAALVLVFDMESRKLIVRLRFWRES